MGLAAGTAASDLRRATVGPAGHLQLLLELTGKDQVLVLYSSQRYPDDDAAYAYSVGAALVAAKGAIVGTDEYPISDLDRVETMLRRREQHLAVAWRAIAEQFSAKSVAATYDLEIGDSKDLIFPEMGNVVPQTVSATVVVANDRAVAWLHDNLRPAGDNIDERQIQEIVDRFAAEDFQVTVNAFGAPSDVDRDGRVHFLIHPPCRRRRRHRGLLFGLLRATRRGRR